MEGTFHFFLFNNQNVFKQITGFQLDMISPLCTLLALMSNCLQEQDKLSCLFCPVENISGKKICIFKPSLIEKFELKSLSLSSLPKWKPVKMISIFPSHPLQLIIYYAIQIGWREEPCCKLLHRSIISSWNALTFTWLADTKEIALSTIVCNLIDVSSLLSAYK